MAELNAAKPERRNKNNLLLNIKFPRVRIEPTTCSVYSHTLVRYDYPQTTVKLLSIYAKLYYSNRNHHHTWFIVLIILSVLSSVQCTLSTQSTQSVKYESVTRFRLYIFILNSLKPNGLFINRFQI